MAESEYHHADEIVVSRGVLVSGQRQQLLVEVELVVKAEDESVQSNSCIPEAFVVQPKLKECHVIVREEVRAVLAVNFGLQLVAEHGGDVR